MISAYPSRSLAPFNPGRYHTARIGSKAWTWPLKASLIRSCWKQRGNGLLDKRVERTDRRRRRWRGQREKERWWRRSRRGRRRRKRRGEDEEEKTKEEGER